MPTFIYEKRSVSLRSTMNPVTSIRNPDESASAQDKVMDLVFTQDDLNWKDVMYDLVRSEGMDPWNIDVSLLAEKFLVMLKELKQMDFRISGKMVLASSLLLKIKSDRLLLEDIAGLDNLINGQQEEEFLDDDGFEFEQQDLQAFFNDQKKIVPRTPQPRERKVSVFDLVDALEQALDQDIKRQRVLSKHREEVEVKAPTRVFDLSETMETIQEKLAKLFVKSKTRVFFDDLVPEESKEAKVYTFLPLLHLENQQKVGLNQEEHFGPIEVTVYNKKL